VVRPSRLHFQINSIGASHLDDSGDSDQVFPHSSEGEGRKLAFELIVLLNAFL
jgi:hypothetical protein